MFWVARDGFTVSLVCFVSCGLPILTLPWKEMTVQSSLCGAKLGHQGRLAFQCQFLEIVRAQSVKIVTYDMVFESAFTSVTIVAWMVMPDTAMEPTASTTWRAERSRAFDRMTTTELAGDHPGKDVAEDAASEAKKCFPLRHKLARPKSLVEEGVHAEGGFHSQIATGFSVFCAHFGGRLWELTFVVLRRSGEFCVR